MRDRSLLLEPRRFASAGWYNAVWRWHFYAGLFCAPFVLWLSLTGSLYLWRPQIEAWLERPYDHLGTGGPVAPADAQVAAALHAVPGASLRRYILPQSPSAAVRIIVAAGGDDTRITLDPRSLAILKVEQEERRPFRLLFHLHGELLAGAFGSGLVETAACWAVVMLASGLYLWWPRGGRRFAGVLYPRLGAGGRMFWRDLHATAGLWVSIFALGLILTGLPWAKVWGSYLVELRHLTGTASGPVDWTIGGRTPKQDPMLGEHAGHGRMAGSRPRPEPGDLARVIDAVRPLAMAPPVLIAPPESPGAPWLVTSAAADRQQRADVRVQGATGRILGRTEFAQRHWIDRAIGIGVAAHEGALFGLANQLLGTLTAFLLSVLSISGVVLWWRRRPAGRLGASPPRLQPRMGLAFAAAIVALGMVMPLFGATLVLVLGAEALVLRRMPAARRWLGLLRIE